MKRISIIIVNWNGKEDTLRCLTSLKKIIPMGHTLKVLVVDNGSTDGSVSAIQKYKMVTIIRASSNLGFSGGNNLGLGMRWITMLTSYGSLITIRIVDPKALSMVDACDDPDVGITGSKIYFAPGKEFHVNRYTSEERGKVIWSAGGIIDWANMYASHRGVDEVDTGQYDKPEETQFVTGCSMMVRRAVFDRIGMLDNRYYLYHEDLDFCLRARKASCKLLYVPTCLEPGLYVFNVFAVWDSRGDISYGFLVKVQ